MFVWRRPHNPLKSHPPIGHAHFPRILRKGRRISAPLRGQSEYRWDPRWSVRLLTSDLCFQGQRFLLALSVRCLQDPNEVTSHMLEVVQAHMQLLGQVRLACLKGVIMRFWSCRTPAVPQTSAGAAIKYGSPGNGAIWCVSRPLM